MLSELDIRQLDCLSFLSQGEGLPLLPGEKKDIEDLLPAATSEEDKETIFSILGQAMCRPAGIQVAYNFIYFILPENQTLSANRRWISTTVGPLDHCDV